MNKVIIKALVDEVERLIEIRDSYYLGSETSNNYLMQIKKVLQTLKDYSNKYGYED